MIRTLLSKVHMIRIFSDSLPLSFINILEFGNHKYKSKFLQDPGAYFFVSA